MIGHYDGPNLKRALRMAGFDVISVRQVHRMQDYDIFVDPNDGGDGDPVQNATACKVKAVELIGDPTRRVSVRTRGGFETGY